MDYAQVETEIRQRIDDKTIPPQDKKHNLPAGMTGPLEHVYIFDRENGGDIFAMPNIKAGYWIRRINRVDPEMLPTSLDV